MFLVLPLYRLMFARQARTKNLSKNGPQWNGLIFSFPFSAGRRGGVIEVGKRTWEWGDPSYMVTLSLLLLKKNYFWSQNFFKLISNATKNR